MTNEEYLIQAYLDRAGGSVKECMIVPIRVLYNAYVQDEGVLPGIGFKQNRKSGRFFITVQFSTIMDLCAPLDAAYWWYRTDGTIRCVVTPDLKV